MSVLFSPSGLVADRAAALAELLPWRAPDPALRLAEERVDDLGGGVFAITRIVENASSAPVAFHAKQRPTGSQNEGFFQARYNKYRPVVEPGYFNDVLAPWPSAFRMWTVARLHDSR